MPRRTHAVFALAAIALLLTTATLRANDDEPTDPRGPQAVAAKTKQDAAVQRAAAAYVRDVLAAKQDYRRELAKSLDTAMHAKDLDEANHVNAAIKQVDTEIATLRTGIPPVLLGAKPPVDLMPLIDVQRDAVTGAWTATKDGLVTDLTTATLRINYKPPPEYDFYVEFTHPPGGHEVTQIAAQNGHHFAWLVGAWSDTVTGFAMVHDQAVRESGACVTAAHFIADGHRHSSLLKVRKGSVAGYVDGKLTFERKTDYADMTAPTYYALNGGDLGIGSKGSPTVFHVIRIQEAH